jgi:hypothetical protein
MGKGQLRRQEGLKSGMLPEKTAILPEPSLKER